MEEQKAAEMPPIAEASNAQQNAGASDTKDIENNKALAIIGYILPILFFVPLITDAKNSPFAKFHANQQLNFLLLIVAAMVISPFLFVILIGFIIMPIIWLIELVLAVMGIINAANGEMKKLPVIGGFTLIK